ncbi:hypothetical protein L202_02920 [Cryptococcus amylolentus CBS 6039]|uniref:Uncharacterized protein n=1 Tax=Cryptococcus amylolentus CBS 6039 TaxID=1295533 RepID=A0A1E3HWQ5_9TREE|nr:hypothetical protein L202_02920 [Cryptococcus amylolentus CBS 6039]ODN80768.1 hypothetical protein L202_02920 [Cryptococcus amylolentus CBS 6039]
MRSSFFGSTDGAPMSSHLSCPVGTAILMTTAPSLPILLVHLTIPSGGAWIRLLGEGLPVEGSMSSSIFARERDVWARSRRLMVSSCTYSLAGGRGYMYTSRILVHLGAFVRSGDAVFSTPLPFSRSFLARSTVERALTGLAYRQYTAYMQM